MNPILISTLTYAAEKLVDGVSSMASAATRSSDEAEFAKLLEAQKASQPPSELQKLMSEYGIKDLDDLQRVLDQMMEQMRTAFGQAGGDASADSLTLMQPASPGDNWLLTDGQHRLELVAGSSLATQADQYQQLQALASNWEQHPSLSVQEVVKQADIHA
ncbi:MAG: hypothetical protein E1N59_70 [Puniceicoccaceae bacterium 5H]|nr:MAG: hypothetical protein E1N59_70 [Puniceicoccaceae bacterium 5H]